MSLKKILTYSLLGLTAIGGFFGNVDIDTSLENTSVISFSVGTNSTYSADPVDPYANETAKFARQGNPPTKTSATSQATIDMYNNAIVAINGLLAVLSALVSPIILFVGWLMSPDWTTGDLFQLRTPMYKLWVTVSNIVYFIYAILLIMIALGTMFGQDKFSYKVMLPKLALGILMVPFTWWFVQWTISTANVVTAAVMTIPSETIGAGDSAWFVDPSIPKNITVDNTSGTGMTSKKITCPTETKSTTDCISPKDFLEKAGGMYGPLVVYGYSIFKFEEIAELKSAVDIASAAIQIVHTSIVSAIMFCVFGILILALAVMLLVRAIKLWMYAIFAPLFTFRFVAGSNLMGGDDDSFSIKEFVGLAFVPAIVGLTLSFGLIMINAVSSTHQGTQPASTKKSEPCKLETTEGCPIVNVMGSATNTITRKIVKVSDDPVKKITETTFKYGDINFIFKGKATNQSNQETTANGTLDSIGGMFGTLIIDVIALVFIWMAFMAAKNVSKAIKTAIQPFEEMGNKIGGLAKKMPSYMPLPVPGGNIKNMGKVADGIGSIAEYRSNKKFEESGVGKWIKEQSNQNMNAADLTKIENALKNNLSNLPSALAGASKESFDSSIVPKILENKDLLTRARLEPIYGAKVTDTIEAIIKDGKIDDEKKAILQALLSKASTDPNITKPFAIEAIEKQKNNPKG
ncbi:hypothetical protein K2X92_03485, partial [Candidatus Gracilibacteria bacterium]|nr:hypothetical protein [Candidatus Gracilibacteria bacterium]